MPSVNPTSKDVLFDVIGSYGLWQKIVFGIFFYFNMTGVWQNFAITFLAPNVPFKCVDSNFTSGISSETINQIEATPNADQCTVNVQFWSSTSGESWNKTVACKKWEYDRSEYSETMVSQWDLVCQNEWLISLAKSIYMMGFMTSVFIFGQVSDCIGRFPTIVICFLITILSLTLSPFSTSFTAFAIFRFMQALGRTGMSVTGIVLLMEIVGVEHRKFVGIAFQLGYSLGMMILALMGYLIRNFFWIQVAIFLPVLPVFFAYKFIPESPRWLIMKNKWDQMNKLIASAARRNGKKLNEDTNKILERIVNVKKEENSGNILDLFRIPGMRSKLFIMLYIWIVNAFLYYGLSFNTNDLSGDPYINFALMGFMEFPSYAVLYLSMSKFGNKIPLEFFMVLGGLSCIALVAVPQDMIWLSTTLAMSGKFAITASFALLYIYTAELYPTVVRNAAIGTCSTFARIGSILAPFTRELGKATHQSVPNVLYFTLAITSALCALWLPETSDKKLLDSLEEAEESCQKRIDTTCSVSSS